MKIKTVDFPLKHSSRTRNCCNKLEDKLVLAPTKKKKKDEKLLK